MRSLRVKIRAPRAISKIATLLVVAILAACSASRAESAPVPVLLELFTSEGCSSCPPADDLLEKLDRTQPVRGAHLIVLSEHIDYWNALGWKDPFSSAQFTARQSEYAGRINAAQGVYTPQLIVDGRESVVGSDEEAVSAAISQALAEKKSPLSIGRVGRSGNDIALHVDGVAPNRAAELYVAVAYDGTRSHVTAGENAGRTLTHVAVVRYLTRVGEFAAGDKINKDIILQPGATSANRLRLVAFLEDRQTGAVLELAEQTLPKA